MSEFDVKFAAYESMMKRNNNFGMSGDALAKYYGDYSVRLQEALTRKDEKAFGKVQAKQIAQERANQAAKFNQVYNNIAPKIEQNLSQSQNPLLKGITYGQAQPQRFIPEVKPASAYDALYREVIEPKVDAQFSQPKNSLLKGITYGQAQPQRFIPEVSPLPTHEVLYREVIEPKVDAQFAQPKNSLLESIKPNQDFRGKNLIGEQLTEAQKILQNDIKLEPTGTKGLSKLAKYGKWGAAIAGVAALGIGAYALFKSCSSDEETKKALQQTDNPLNKKPKVEPQKPQAKDKPQKTEKAEDETPKAAVPSDSTKSEKVDSTNIAKSDSTKSEKADSTNIAKSDSTKSEKADSTNIAKSDSTKSEKADSTNIAKTIAAPVDSTDNKKTKSEKSEDAKKADGTTDSKETKESNKAEKSEESNKPKETEQAKAPEFIPLLQIDEDGTYTTRKNDSFWRIAKKHLKDKFKAQGIDRNPTNAEIQKETDRIMNANNYGYDKNHWFSDPMLQPNVKLIIEQKLDKAA